MATNPVVFVRQASDEIRKVTWPARAEVIRLSVSVVIIAGIVGLFLGGLDFLFTKILEVILK